MQNLARVHYVGNTTEEQMPVKVTACMLFEVALAAGTTQVPGQVSMLPAD